MLHSTSSTQSSQSRHSLKNDLQSQWPRWSPSLHRCTEYRELGIGTRPASVRREGVGGLGVDVARSRLSPVASHTRRRPAGARAQERVRRRLVSREAILKSVRLERTFAAPRESALGSRTPHSPPSLARSIHVWSIDHCRQARSAHELPSLAPHRSFPHHPKSARDDDVDPVDSRTRTLGVSLPRRRCRSRTMLSVPPTHFCACRPRTFSWSASQRRLTLRRTSKAKRFRSFWHSTATPCVISNRARRKVSICC